MTVVFDTNILVAAVVTEGLCSTLLHRARAREFSLVVCPFILNELNRIFSKKFKLSRTERSLALEVITEAISAGSPKNLRFSGVESKVVSHNIRIPKTCVDKDDDNIIACAVAAKVD